MNAHLNLKRTLLAGLGTSILAIACMATYSRTETWTDRTIDPDGTITEEEHTIEVSTSNPVGGTLSVDALGVSGSLGVTTQNGDGETTETDVAEGEEVDIPKDTKSVSTELETGSSSQPPSGSPAPGSSPQGLPHQIVPFEFRTSYRAWPEPLADVSACVSVRGHSPNGGQSTTPRSTVKARMKAIGDYFRQGQMGLTPDGTPTGSPLPSFPDVDVIVREVSFVEVTATGVNLHFYDTLPFEWLEFTLNGADYSLQTPGALNAGSPVNGWYHAIIPVPASGIQLYSTYDSTIKRQGSNQLGGCSKTLVFTLP